MATKSLYTPISQPEKVLPPLTFTSEDLAMNQMGRLSKRQQNAIYWNEQSRWLKPLIILAILGLLLLSFISYILLTLMVSEIEQFPTWPLVMGIVLGFLMIWSAVEAAVNYHDIQQKIQSDVQAVQGAAIIDMRGFLLIDDVVFTLPQENLRRLKHLEQYVVYYLAHGNQVLSIEVLKR